MLHLKTLGAAITFGLLITPLANAHVSVSGDRTLGVIDNSTATNNVRTVRTSFGWADGTDSDWGDSHQTTPFKFTLNTTQTVTISLSRRAAGTGPVDTLLPAFSLYQTPLWVASTHDTGPATTTYLTTTFGTGAVAEPFTDVNLNGFWNIGESFTDTNGDGVYTGAGIGGSGKEGAFRALSTWEIYHDSVGGARMHFDTYLGNRADGTSANFGSAAGINGDGVADGTVTGTFTDLAPGEYYIFTGGANYFDQLTNVGYPDSGALTYGISLSVTAVPEPSTYALLALGLGAAAWVRFRMTRKVE